MLGLVLIYFVGRYFNRLAKEYNKNGVLYAILGIVTYYGSQLVVGLLLGLYIIRDDESLDFFEENRLLITIISIPIGLLGTWGLHAFLKNKWSNKVISVDETILDDDVYLKE